MIGREDRLQNDLPGCLSPLHDTILYHTKALNIGHRRGNEQLAILAD